MVGTVRQAKHNWLAEALADRLTAEVRQTLETAAGLLRRLMPE